MDLEALKSATREAGFDHEWTELEVAGSVSRGAVEGAPALSLSLQSRDQEILILPGDGRETRLRFAEVARSAGDPAKTLRIRGRAHSRQGGRIAMTVKKFQVVGE